MQPGSPQTPPPFDEIADLAWSLTVGTRPATASRGDIIPTTPLEAIGFDSLAFVEFGALVEERFGLEIEPVVEVTTVGDLAGLVQRAAPVEPVPHHIPRGLGRLQAPTRTVLRPLFKSLFPFEVEGLHHVPERGPVLLCLNHDSAFDIVYTALSIPRPVAVMSKAEVFLGPVTSAAIHEMGGFQVDRDRLDRWAVQVAQELLDKGQVLAMYPEGTRHAGSLLPFLPGAAYVALTRGLPMIPVALVGTDRVLPRDRTLPRLRLPVRVIVGRPMPVEAESDPTTRLRRALELTDDLQDRIATMLGEAEPARAVLKPV